MENKYQTIVKRYVVPQGVACYELETNRVFCQYFSKRKKECMAFQQCPAYLPNVKFFHKLDICIACEITEYYPSREEVNE
jgi:hypothetical protein